MRRRALGVIFGAVLTLVIASTALADSCANVSRAPAPCGFACTTVVTDGNWVCLPSLVNIGIPANELPPFWGFNPPGGPDAQFLGTPGAGGNDQNGSSKWLLGHSASA